MTFENLVGTYGRTGNRSQPEGVYEVFRTHQSKLLGSIAYVLKDAVYDPTTLTFGISDAGSAAGQGNYDPASQVLVKHILSYIDPAHAQFADKRALRFDYDPPGPHGTNNRAEAMVGVSGQPLSCQGPSWVCTNVQQGLTLAAAIGAGKSVWTDSAAAPGICKRYVGGVLTETPLWPLPITQRLKDAMAQAGQTPVDITAVMEQLFGPIPDSCRTDGTAPMPPEPTPPGPVAINCTGMINAVPGPVTLTCTTQTRQR